MLQQRLQERAGLEAELAKVSEQLEEREQQIRFVRPPACPDKPLPDLFCMGTSHLDHCDWLRAHNYKDK